MRLTRTKLLALHQEALDERYEWEAEYRQLSSYLLPGRGIYTGFTKPRKRSLTTKNVINTLAEEALYVLTSGMHGALTSPGRMWFRHEWSDWRVRQNEDLVQWLQTSSQLLHNELHDSNFYSIINSFYVELVGFGTGAVYVGADSKSAAFRFECLTAGEYAFTTDTNGRANMFFRTMFMSPKQIVERFPSADIPMIRRKASTNEGGVITTDWSVVECVYAEKFQDKPYTQIFYLVSNSASRGYARERGETDTSKPLDVRGFYEFPYIIARWNTIGQDIYGIGPGSRALSDIKRLQQLEKAFLMATHKTIDPPLAVPSRLRGQVNTLPGALNYTVNPGEEISELYRVNFDYNGVSAAIERVEQRIQRKFFNDIFLTASRDPNASPYKATEVTAREQEKMLRLGPVVERLQHEFLQPLVERCFNIMARKEMLPPIDPAMIEQAGSYDLSLVSPLATAQRAVALQGINSFMAFLGQAAQFDQRVLDNVNPDAAAREYADITGVHLGVLRKTEEIAQIREARAKEMARQQAMQEKLALAQTQGQMDVNKAQASRQQAEAGVALAKSQQMSGGVI